MLSVKSTPSLLRTATNPSRCTSIYRRRSQIRRVSSDLSRHSSTSTRDERRKAALIDTMIRVDRAGEVAANWIYSGQSTVLGTDPQVGKLIHEMWEQEKKHLATMDKLQLQHRVRPTLMSDVAKGLGFALGVCTALMGKEAAMACTEAVETVIGEHYDDQLKELESIPNDDDVESLKRIITEFRDDELEHLDTAVEHHSQRAPAHALLSVVIGKGCEFAIEVCKRV